MAGEGGRPRDVDLEFVARAQRIHDATTVTLMHTDLVADVSERRSFGERAVLGRLHSAPFRRGKVKCLSDHVIGDTFETQLFPTQDLLKSYYKARFNPSLTKHAMKVLAYFLDDLDESADDFVLATTVAQIRAHAKMDKLSIVLCFQGTGPIEDEPALLGIYHRLGLRVFNGTINNGRDNTILPTAMTPHLGLTRAGTELLDEVTRLKMVMDVSGMSAAAFWEVLERYDAPVIASNTNARAVLDFSASFTDEQLKGIAQHGGVVGVTANSNYISPGKKPTLAQFVEHIEHMVEVMGIDHVGIGPDLLEDSEYPIDTYHRLFQDVGYYSCSYPDDFEHIEQLPNVSAELLRRGYRDEDVKKILGENVLRVYARVWGA